MIHLINMKLYRLYAALFLFSTAAPVFPQESLDSYIADLDRLSTAIGNAQDKHSIGEIVRNMPEEWDVRMESRQLRVGSGWLRKGMFEPDARRSLLSRIALLKTEALAFRHPPQDMSSYREALAGILAQRQFREVRAPNQIDNLRNRILLWIARMLNHILGDSAFPVVSRIMIWILIGAAVMVMAWWILKSIRQNAGLDADELQSVPISAKPFQDWMAEANAAAAKGCWRDAVHLSYWAGISFLESQGLWCPDAARTPREYLRLIKPSCECRSSLLSLTRRFETVWYGYGEAGPESFAETLKCLEGMGCGNRPAAEEI
jgi:hypothetical protein